MTRLLFALGRNNNGLSGGGELHPDRLPLAGGTEQGSTALIRLRSYLQALLLFLMLFVPIASWGQRAFKPIKTALKDKNYAEALNQVNKLRQDSLYRNDPKLCLYIIEANQGLNDAQNMKAYLKSSYDTVAFFSTTREIIREAQRLDSINRADEDGPNRKQTEYVCNLLRQYLPNIHAAARFYYVHRNFPETMSYLRICLDLPRTPIGEEATLSRQADTLNAQLYLTSAYAARLYPETHRYEQLALSGDRQRPLMFECLVRTAVAENDSATQRRLLETAFAEYPQRPPFFTQLADFYSARGDYARMLNIADRLTKLDSLNVSALAARSIALLNLGRYGDCIVAASRVLAADSTRYEANYYAGASYVAKASAVVLPDNALSAGYKKAHADQLALYRQARTYLELYREQMPQQTKRWAPLLYKVYLALNEGKKFAEIEALISNP